MGATTMATLAALAIVAQDHTALRAAPRDSAPQQAVLWAGDTLEVRGVKGDFLQVYDHRRERAGFVRAPATRPLPLEAAQAPALRTVVTFLRDAPGAEALGIGYAAAYLRAAPAETIDGNLFADIGAMAERLADRVSAAERTRQRDVAATAQLDVVAHYGIRMESAERDGQVRLCYDGEAWRRTMALAAEPQARAQAALALTREDCIATTLTPTERAAQDRWRADVLARVDPAPLPPAMQQRLRVRKASVWASIAFARARAATPDATEVRAAGVQALDALAGIDAGELDERDQAAFNDAAMAVGAVRWAAEADTDATTGTLFVTLRSGELGQTCIDLRERRQPQATPLVSRCTYGKVWPASANAERKGKALALAVQPMDGWRETWVFRQTAQGWQVDALPPAASGPALGYVEFAGWVPGGKEMLVAGEAREGGRYRKRFAVVDVETLAMRKQADHPRALSAFYRWQSPQWKAVTVSLR